MEHEKLLDEWAQQHHHVGKGFVRDGIIDPNKWKYVQCRVLFINKEAYDDKKPNQDWDLRELIRDNWKGPAFKIWWLIAYWAYAIHNWKSCRIPQMPNTKEEYELASKALLSSAAINVKKSDGKKSSDNDEINDYVKKDGIFIKKQIELIDPQIIICGNVWEHIKEHIWPEATERYHMVYKADKYIFIDLWHPSNPYPNNLNYYTLCAVLHASGVI